MAEKTVEPVNPTESKRRIVTLSNFPFYCFIFWIIWECRVCQRLPVCCRELRTWELSGT